MIRRGESVHLIEVDVRRGSQMLTPVGSWDIAGPLGTRPTWWYRADTVRTVRQPVAACFRPASVVHCRYSTSTRPTRG